ncbi:Copia protein, partial [Mucuna pruriens]
MGLDITETKQRVVRYLKGSPGRGLFYPRKSELQLLGFSDADWAGSLDSRSFLLRSNKQFPGPLLKLNIVLSQLLQWLLYLLKDLHVTCQHAPVLYCDNQSAMHVASNSIFHERTKHLEIDGHFVYDKVQNGVFCLLPISSRDQLADFLTKALSPQSFLPFISKLGMLDIYHASACGVLRFSNPMAHMNIT